MLKPQPLRRPSFVRWAAAPNKATLFGRSGTTPEHLVSKNSEGAECADGYPDEADNPGFSEKQYSCEKNGVIHFCIMTG